VYHESSCFDFPRPAAMYINFNVYIYIYLHLFVVTSKFPPGIQEKRGGFCLDEEGWVGLDWVEFG
jgi:hypothetical protein